MLKEKFLEFGEYAAAGLYEECDRSLFYRKALGLRRYLESCELAEYNGERLYPSGAVKQKMKISMDYLNEVRLVVEKVKREISNSIDDNISHVIALSVYLIKTF